MSGSAPMDSPDATDPRIGATKGFRPDVQALRGLAVLLVVLYHSRFLARGGFIGVDVFFVISGFVIGRQLFGEFTRNDRLSFTSFYVRRARRILPPLAAMLAIVVLLAPLLAPIDAVDTNRTSIAAALFSANIYLFRTIAVGYFAVSAELNPLLHTWSLSVEEQFYFVIPALLALGWRFGSRAKRSLLTSRILIALLIVVSFALCVAFSESTSIGPIRAGLRFAFFSPFTRAWEFGVGLALVLLPARFLRSTNAGRVMVTVGLGGIAFAAFAYSDATRFPGWTALVPVLGAALVIAGGTATGAGSRSPHRGLRPMIAAGNISYSWYLWHWPLIVFAAAFWPSAGNIPLVAAAAFSLVPALLSYLYLEQRFRIAPSRRHVGVLTLTLAAICIAIPLAATALSIPIQKRIMSTDQMAAMMQMKADPASITASCWMETREENRDNCTWNAGTDRPSVVLIGDSNASQFSEAMIGAARANGASLEISSQAGCPFADVPTTMNGAVQTECQVSISRAVASLVESRPDVVIIASAADRYISSSRIPDLTPIAIVDESGSIITSEADAAAEYTRGLSRTITTLQDAGIRVAVVDVVPKPYFGTARICSVLGLIHDPNCGFDDTNMINPGFNEVATRATAEAAAETGADFWSFNAEVCPDGTCIGFRDGVYVWRDVSHISAATSESLAGSAAELLRRSLAGANPAG